MANKYLQANRMPKNIGQKNNGFKIQRVSISTTNYDFSDRFSKMES
jgi:hypothetical protein